jgi:hypothetical protein
MLRERGDFARSPDPGEQSMKLARSIMLAIAAMLGASGCRAWNTGSLAPTPRPLAGNNFDVDAFVAEHNRNADLIQTLEAKMSIGIKTKLMPGAGADGRLAMERPRNFKLELSSVGNKKADIGSNDEEFWFWVQNDEKRIYWCNYDEAQSSTLAVTYQPDWIIEALGLKPISPEEAAKIKVRDSDVPGTTALMFPPTRNGAETYTRMMIVWNQSRRVKQHRIYQGTVPSTKGLLAQAEVSRFAEFVAGNDDSDEPKKCYLAERVTLEWKQDQLTLDARLKKDSDGQYAVKVNQFDSSRSAGLFVEPIVQGHERVNLAEMGRAQSRDSHGSVRETLPPPAPRNGRRSGRPTIDADDTTMAPRRKPADDSAEGDSSTSPLEDLVGPASPVGPRLLGTQTASGPFSPRDALNQVER